MSRTNRFGRRSRRSLLTAVAVFVTGVVFAACGSSSTPSGTTVNAAAGGAVAANSSSSAAASPASAPYTVNFSYIGSTPGLTGPWGFAYTKGVLQQWLKADGVTLKLSEFANGPLMTAAMTGGSVDMGVLGDTPALIAKSQGLQATAISQPELNLVAWVIAQPSIHSLSQLSGKTVAVQQGSYLDRYFQGLLAQDGLTSKVHRVAMLSTQSTPAFEGGHLDAVLAAPTQWPALLKTGKGYNVIAKSETTPSLEGTQVTLATDKFLAAHPGLPKVWNAVRVKSVAYAKAHSAAYYAWAAKQANTTPAATEQAAPLSAYPIPNFTTVGTQHLQSTLNFLIAQKEAKPFSIQQWELQ
jgi:sulfonate transport system substrate-binding protein